MKDVLLKRLEKYSKREPMWAVNIASELKLTESATVRSWLRSGKIPHRDIDLLIRYLNEAEREITP